MTGSVCVMAEKINEGGLIQISEREKWFLTMLKFQS